jgi:CheY-like chemotaxis protein
MDQPQKSCLLIDDDIDDQEIFTLALDQLDNIFHCMKVNNGLEALAYLRDKEKMLPDYIFLDLNMPRMNGLECLKEIKKLRQLPYIPVIIYSTSTSKNDIAEAHKFGAAAFITKPFSLTELTDTLRIFFQTQQEALPASYANSK